ncbi:MAG: hypothetical protein ACFHU9_17005 [Fluviicola sp.]
MKQTLLLLVAAVAMLFGFNSCNEDITTSGNFQETAVVYGLLDRTDSIHIVKITRAFIGPGNSLEISQIPDSNYFQSVTATVTEQLPGGVTGRTWNLYDTLVDTKETNGVFYAPEQIVYAFKSGSLDDSDNPTFASLNTDATYNLRILINEGTSSEFEVFGSTQIISGISTSTDSPNYQFKFATNSVSTGEYTSSPMFVTHGNATVVNTKLAIDYKEYVGGDSTEQRINWTWGEIPTGSGSTTNFTGQGETFYNLIANACAAGNPAVTRRNLTGITVEIVGGSEDLYNYILVNQPSSSLAQNKPTFTNLTATNEHPVIGLFSSRFTHRVYHPMVGPNQNQRCIDRNSTMELCVGPITGPYLFCSQQTLDIAQGQPWACN